MTATDVSAPASQARIPGSKSLTNRALLLAAAAGGVSKVWAPLVSDDTVAFRAALTSFGVAVRSSPTSESWEVTGLGGGPVGQARLWCADAGTAARFLPPFAATGRGAFLFDGSSQLRARPSRPLVEALRHLGAHVGTGPGGGLPLLVCASDLPGGELTVDSSLSSQYLSGLLMAAPLMRNGLLARAEALVSSPYVDMTLTLMRHFGARVAETADGGLRVEPGGYTPTDLVIEPDASTASYFFAAAAITGRTITVPGLGTGSLQGDLGFVDVLEKAGAQVTVTDSATTVRGGGGLRGGFDVDMGEISDTFMTLAAIAPLADAPITIHGIGHARLKESDRIAAVASNLRACGIQVAEGTDWITVHPGRPAPARISCHRDHRIAMSFSVLALGSGVPLELDDPDCVTKTFPGFHAELHRLFPGTPDSEERQ
ncbi:3-phosphoshikimate 1-carboxyvinyltransferase [Streptomyces sp.]|uniref:3-phosphoshikimate 1-carboxyvinyltransferase n=1 Tax=Streptomyces sp. TaxID=1931 RepID=UPI002D4B323F|nr:3-phosphoshikimate 1-carboxyvinyltransferase [Streptomyces sp.]HZF87190.1 3-phosphoshikimate 1-carboxyvinyltransferase [Streptomyces sp.]